MWVSFKDLQEAFEFVSAGGGDEREAFLCKRTGKIYCHSKLVDDLDPLPDDIGDGDKFLQIPDKHDLDLGKPLASDFAGEFLADNFEEVRRFFGKKGAYARFKQLLERRGVIDQWYAFEAENQEKALRAWCELNSIAVAGE